MIIAIINPFFSLNKFIVKSVKISDMSENAQHNFQDSSNILFYPTVQRFSVYSDIKVRKIAKLNKETFDTYFDRLLFFLLDYLMNDLIVSAAD